MYYMYSAIPEQKQQPHHVVCSLYSVIPKEKNTSSCDVLCSL